MRTRATRALKAISTIVAFGFCASAVHAQAWSETAAEVERLAAAGEFAEAAALGPELLERATREFGESSEQVAESYLMLSKSELANGDVAAAERNVLSAIDILAREQGRDSLALVEPLRLVGETYQAVGAHEPALAAFAEARAIIRRTFGLSNPGQADALQEMAESTAAMGKLEEAVALQAEAIELVSAAYGDSSKEVLGAFRRLGDLLREHGYYRPASEQYELVGRQLLRGDDPVEGVRMLLLAARMLRLEGPPNPNGDDVGTGGPRRGLGRGGGGRAAPSRPTLLLAALESVRRLPMDLPLLRAEVIRDIGDWAVVFGIPDQLESSYEEAWRTLASVTNADEVRREWFERTVPLDLAPLRSRVLSSEIGALEGHVELEFTIGTNGTAGDVMVTAAEPVGLVDREAIRRIENSRFRPKVEDGRVVPSTHTLRFDFGYAPRYAEE